MPTKPQNETISQSQLAEAIGCGQRYVRKLAEAEAIPEGVRGHYPLVETVQALCEFFRSGISLDDWRAISHNRALDRQIAACQRLIDKEKAEKEARAARRAKAHTSLTPPYGCNR